MMPIETQGGVHSIIEADEAGSSERRSLAQCSADKWRERMRLAVVAVSLAIACGACEIDSVDLPTPRISGLDLACYPVQFVSPPMPPPLRACDIDSPDAATVLMEISSDGHVVKATIPQAPSSELSACLADALALWRLEPARDCGGTPLPSRFEMSYRDVFGWDPCMVAPIAGRPAGTPIAGNAASGRTSGCS